MTTGADTGYGTTFGISDDQTVTGSFNNVAGVTNVTAPAYSRDTIDTSDMDSSDEYREYIAGFQDGGEVTLDLNWVPSASDVVLAALEQGQGAFRITFPGSVTCTFLAIPNSYTPVAPFDDKMTTSASFKITGKPVWD